MAYGEAVEWWGRLMEFGVQNCVSGFELQEDAPNFRVCLRVRGNGLIGGAVYCGWGRCGVLGRG